MNVRYCFGLACPQTTNTGNGRLSSRSEILYNSTVLDLQEEYVSGVISIGYNIIESIG